MFSSRFFTLSSLLAPVEVVDIKPQKHSERKSEETTLNVNRWSGEDLNSRFGADGEGGTIDSFVNLDRFRTRNSSTFDLFSIETDSRKSRRHILDSFTKQAMS